MNSIVSDSYTNTEELMAKFPLEHATPVRDGIEESIRNRLLNGFENWNRGFDAWRAWGGILYTPDSIYNVQGARLTLAEYQAAMNILLAKKGIIMGMFHNMVICGEWCAIHYDSIDVDYETGEKNPGSVMEFVRFKDYGPGLGTRVVEGWGGVKSRAFKFFCTFQNEKESAAQQAATQYALDYTVPQTDSPEAAYPILNPTVDNSEIAAGIHKAVPAEFDIWNKGIKEWSAHAENYYAADAVYHTADCRTLTLDELRSELAVDARDKHTERLYINTLLISGEWAALHYEIRETDIRTGEKYVRDVMSFRRYSVVDGKAVIKEEYVE